MTASNLYWGALLAAIAVPLLALIFPSARRLLDHYRVATPQLKRDDFQRFRVVAREVVNRGERPVIFLTLGVSTAGLPTGSHVKIRASVNGTEVIRSYTPTRFDKGECELMFRVYPSGPMTQHLSKLRVGDDVEMMGPTGLERYAVDGPGSFSRGSKVWKGIEHIGMLSGGTGITPMLQICNHVLQDSHDPTSLSLLSFTNTVADIMLDERLRTMAERSRGALRLTFVASQASEEDLKTRPDVRLASMRTLTSDQLIDMLGVPADSSTMIAICGPDGFVQSAKALLAGRFDNVLVW